MSGLSGLAWVEWESVGRYEEGRPLAAGQGGATCRARKVLAD